MTVDQAIRSILCHLPPDVAEALEYIDIEHRREPSDEDRAKGATDDHHGYFFGHATHKPEATEIPGDPPQGLIVIYTDKIKPLTQEGIAAVLLHEIAHAIGYTEGQIRTEMGL